MQTAFSPLARAVPWSIAEEGKMKTRLLVVTLLAGSSMFAETHFSIGIGIGGQGYAAPPVAYASPRPGPGYTWIDGYWERVGPRRHWRSGYWAAPAYQSSYRAVPFDRDNRYSRDRDDRRVYEDNRSGYEDRNRFNNGRDQNGSNVNQGQNGFNTNGGQNNFDMNRAMNAVRTNQGQNGFDPSRNVGSIPTSNAGPANRNGNRPDNTQVNGSGTNGNPFNGSGRR
jgi:hypothetical protein